MTDDELTLTEISQDPEFKGLKTGTLRNALNRGDLSGRKRAKTWFVTKSAVREWVDRQNEPGRRGKRIKWST